MRKTGLGKGVVSLSLVVTELLALDLLYYYWPKSNFLYSLLEGAEEFDLINITIVVHHFLRRSQFRQRCRNYTQKVPK